MSLVEKSEGELSRLLICPCVEIFETALQPTACVYGGCAFEARPCPRGRNEVKKRARQSQRSPAAAINTLLCTVRSVDRCFEANLFHLSDGFSETRSKSLIVDRLYGVNTGAWANSQTIRGLWTYVLAASRPRKTVWLHFIVVTVNRSLDFPCSQRAFFWNLNVARWECSSGLYLKLLSTGFLRGVGTSKFMLSPVALDFFVRMVHNGLCLWRLRFRSASMSPRPKRS